MREKKRFDVICIGQVCQDMIMAGIERESLLQDGQTIYADSFTYTVGGDSANEAIVLARLGNHTGLLTNVDSGVIGTMIRNELVSEGVDAEPLITVTEGENLVSVVLIRPDGSHNFILPRRDPLSLKRGDYDLELFRQTRVVSAASLFSLGEIDTDGIDEIFRTVKESGGITVADTNLDLFGIGKRGVDHVFPYTDYLIPSMSEAYFITDRQDDDEIADFFLERGVGHVILKQGEKGCFFKSREERFFMPAFQIQPKDTTGCGDNFMAGFIHGLLQGWDHRTTARFACACGALNALSAGAHAGVHSEKQVLTFLEKEGIINTETQN